MTIGANNSSTLYMGILTGGAGLTKTGSGTLTIGSAQYYNGPTTINGGMLTLGAVPAGAAAVYLFDNTSGTASGSTVYNNATSGLANKNATLVNGATIAVGGGLNGAQRPVDQLCHQPQRPDADQSNHNQWQQQGHRSQRRRLDRLRVVQRALSQ